MTIHEFAIGMGPKILTRTSTKTGITYSLRAFPIGGFVSMEGEDEESADENAFNQKPVWQRMIVTIAGAFMNVALGVIVMSFLVASQDVLPSNVIGGFAEYEDREMSYAYEEGLRIGDEIIEIEGTRVHIANETVYEIMRKGIEPIDITVIRDGVKVVLGDVTFPTFTESGSTFASVDFKVNPETKTPMTVLKHATFRSVSTIKMIWESLYDMVTGRYGVESVSGPVGVTKALGEAAEEGISDLVYLAVVISMNLGVMNLLPLPALDGGRIFFQLVELVFHKPLKREVEGCIHFAGLVILMILMVVIAVKDVIQLL